MNLDDMKVLIIAFICIYLSTFPVYSAEDKLKESDKLLALANMYGYARYFYPNQEVKNWDWYKFLAYAQDELKECSGTEEDLKKCLTTIFSPIIPELTFEDPENRVIIAPKYPFYVWRHKGIGKVPMGDFYNSEIISCVSFNPDQPIPDSLYCFPLKTGLNVYMPIATSYKHENNPKLKDLNKKIEKYKFSLFDNSTFTVLLKKLFQKNYKPTLGFLKDEKYLTADMIVKWNLIKHFYPYFQEDSLENQWESILIDKFAEINTNYKDVKSYYLTVCNLFSYLKDSHVVIYPSIDLGGSIGTYIDTFYPDLKIGFVNDTIYIEKVPEQYKDLLSIGDVITQVNGIPIDSLVYLKSKLISSSSKQALYERLCHQGELFKCFLKDSTINITVKGTSKEKEFAVQTNRNYYYYKDNRNPDFFKELDTGIYYINTTIKGKDAGYTQFKKHLSEFQQAKGLIIDIRGYPRYDTDSILTHFSSNPIAWGDFRLPIYYYPNQQSVVYEKEDDSFLQPAKEQIPVPVSFLIDSKAISYAETIIEIIKKNRLGTLIGQPTMGTNGDLSNIYLPVFGFKMTVMKDFSGYHGKGIEPDILVVPTLNDIRNGKDLILEKTINIIKQ